MQKVGKTSRKQQDIPKHGDSWPSKPYDSSAVPGKPTNPKLKTNQRINEEGLIKTEFFLIMAYR